MQTASQLPSQLPSLAAYTQALAPAPAFDPRVWGFVAASVVLHLLLFAVAVAFLRPLILPARLGEFARLDVHLTPIAPIDTIALVQSDAPITLLPLLPMLSPPPALPRVRELQYAFANESVNELASELPPGTAIPPAAALATPPAPTPATGLPSKPMRVEGDAQGTPIPEAPLFDPRPIDVIGRVAVGPVDDLARLPPTDAARIRQTLPVAVHRVPQLVGSLAVPYPSAALRSHSEGRVLVLTFIDADGKVSEAKALPEQSVFAPSALAALKGARFLPALLNEKPLPYWTMLEFVFTIAGEPATAVPANR